MIFVTRHTSVIQESSQVSAGSQEYVRLVFRSAKESFSRIAFVPEIGNISDGDVLLHVEKYSAHGG